MSSAPQVERFKGTGWEECDEFISAIRARALWEGKQRDSAWKADFATPLFSGKALSWHSRLPEDVREDWSKLEIALLDRWPPSDDHEKPQIQPTPAAAAPSQDRDDKANHRIQSVLKVVLDEFNKAYYLKSFGEWCDLTSDRNEALRVGCNSLSSATQLERIDDPRHSWLAVQWQFHTRVIGKGSTYFGKVTLIDSDTLKSSWHNSEPFQVNIWTVLPNGEVIPVWKKDDKTEVTVIPFVSNGKGRSYLYLASDAEAYAQENDDLKRAKFFLELEATESTERSCRLSCFEYSSSSFAFIVVALGLSLSLFWKTGSGNFNFTGTS